ncbi:MAG TPA: winged helix-turn-helix transcriptional regulator, partial [Devosia sp.]|nr:winged helix-turn-helix transcriptional regulator [Devosia sp.]
MSLPYFDEFNRKILSFLQRNGSMSQRELSQHINLSPNACWNRLQALKKKGIVLGQTVRLDREKLGLGLVVFVMVKTRNHSGAWLTKF